LGAEAYNPSTGLVVGSRLPELAKAMRILRCMYPTASIAAAFSECDRAIVELVKAAAREEAVSYHLLKPKFPQQMDELLMPVLLGKPCPLGGRAIDAGVLVIDLQTMLAIHDAVVLGKPPLDRIVALCGPGFAENVHVRARIGAAVSEVATARLRPGSSWRLVENSLMLGSAIDDPASFPIGRGTRAIIAISDEPAEGIMPFVHPGLHFDSHSRAFASSLLPLGKRIDTNVHGEERACLSCGFCEEVCPARIMPNLLHRYVRRGITEEVLIKYGMNRCIDCNLCTYVCTSKIDVAALMREGKRRLLAEGLSEPEPRVPPGKREGLGARKKNDE
jgi:electron transport complex protein RnfC